MIILFDYINDFKPKFHFLSSYTFGSQYFDHTEIPHVVGSLNDLSHVLKMCLKSLDYNLKFHLNQSIICAFVFP